MLLILREAENDEIDEKETLTTWNTAPLRILSRPFHSGEVRAALRCDWVPLHQTRWTAGSFPSSPVRSPDECPIVPASCCLRRISRPFRRIAAGFFCWAPAPLRVFPRSGTINVKIEILDPEGNIFETVTGETDNKGYFTFEYKVIHNIDRLGEYTFTITAGNQISEGSTFFVEESGGPVSCVFDDSC